MTDVTKRSQAFLTACATLLATVPVSESPEVHKVTVELECPRSGRPTYVRFRRLTTLTCVAIEIPGAIYSLSWRHGEPVIEVTTWNVYAGGNLDGFSEESILKIIEKAIVKIPVFSNVYVDEDSYRLRMRKLQNTHAPRGYSNGAKKKFDADIHNQMYELHESRNNSPAARDAWNVRGLL